MDVIERYSCSRQLQQVGRWVGGHVHADADRRELLGQAGVGGRDRSARHRRRSSLGGRQNL